MKRITQEWANALRCPIISSGGYTEKCISDKCMAWEYREARSIGDKDDVVRLGVCLLITESENKL